MPFQRYALRGVRLYTIEDEGWDRHHWLFQYDNSVWTAITRIFYGLGPTFKSSHAQRPSVQSSHFWHSVNCWTFQSTLYIGVQRQLRWLLQDLWPSLPIFPLTNGMFKVVVQNQRFASQRNAGDRIIIRATWMEHGIFVRFWYAYNFIFVFYFIWIKIDFRWAMRILIILKVSHPSVTNNGKRNFSKCSLFTISYIFNQMKTISETFQWGNGDARISIYFYSL